MVCHMLRSQHPGLMVARRSAFFARCFGGVMIEHRARPLKPGIDRPDEPVALRGETEVISA